MKPLLLLIFFLATTCLLIVFFRSRSSDPDVKLAAKPGDNSSISTYQRIKSKAAAAKQYTKQNGYSTRYQFLIDYAPAQQPQTFLRV